MKSLSSNGSAPRLSRRAAISALGVGAALASLPTQAAAVAPAPADDDAIDALVRAFMADFQTPGMGVAIVRLGQPDYLKAYGVRTLGQPARVDIHTQFAIASNSKAFTSASLAMLVDEDRLNWDDPVIRHLPEFRMYDPAVTQMMTVRDMLLHRSGLPLGAGDLLQFPTTDHTREDLLHALPYFKPATGFRAGYAYDNILYILAGLVVERVSGQTWDQFVANRIFTPLGMADAVTNPTLVRGPNHVGRHARLGPPVIGMGPLEVVQPAETALIGPAGGINSSLSDAVRWLQVQLGRGATPDGRRLWSAAQAEQMWTAGTIISSGPGPTADRPDRAVMQAYALGWGVSDYRGRRMLSHSGGVIGQITRTTLLPEQNIGFVVYSNASDETPVSGLRYALMDHLLGETSTDWLAWSHRTIKDTEAEVVAVMGQGGFKAPPGGPSLPLDHYVGRYRDPWYGDILIGQKDGRLTVNFTHTPALNGALEPFGPDAFRTRFARGAGEDAVIQFSIRGGQVAGATLKALSPLADFSFDYQDLTLTRVTA